MFDERQATNPAAKEILEILDRGTYFANGHEVSIGDEQSECETNTRLYTPDDLKSLRRAPARRGQPIGRIEVIDATTQEAAKSLCDGGPVVLLNYASARNPGGGFLGGAKAQEEELCRCSGLYRSLVTKPDYYVVNRSQRSLLYTDHMIYSPRVPFLRLSAKSEFERPFFPSVITAPAPNAGALQRNHPEDAAQLEPTFERRWANVFAVAGDTEHPTVIVGAWGCGAFRNDPNLVARAARQVLQSHRFAAAFDRVVFAIPDFGKRGSENLRAFRRVMEDEL